MNCSKALWLSARTCMSRVLGAVVMAAVTACDSSYVARVLQCMSFNTCEGRRCETSLRTRFHGWLAASRRLIAMGC